MKKLIVGSLILVSGVIVGYLIFRPRASQPTEISNEGYTWKVGATVVNGTNLPAGDFRFTAIRTTNVAPQTNGSKK